MATIKSKVSFSTSSKFCTSKEQFASSCCFLALIFAASISLSLKLMPKPSQPKNLHNFIKT